ncbi:hypothetical protein H257_05931 [Aphanomyces astaci]|uniref:Uncharacterized protein n=1 Tax=Aphanomyces astaci TaxID=112090 RepID=W4GQV4_APHAT|nr:hypothetical protein H257_05931 [Aphanomyces astaci]ETV81399.1 hypothetical protein H257_05931 [Aphanomyces astaci]|eukprot:XP_009829257.1 hypothetical protein H257_05931 [Aphanomyces astaci]
MLGLVKRVRYALVIEYALPLIYGAGSLHNAAQTSMKMDWSLAKDLKHFDVLVQCDELHVVPFGAVNTTLPTTLLGPFSSIDMRSTSLRPRHPSMSYFLPQICRHSHIVFNNVHPMGTVSIGAARARPTLRYYDCHSGRKLGASARQRCPPWVTEFDGCNGD